MPRRPQSKFNICCHCCCNPSPLCCCCCFSWILLTHSLVFSCLSLLLNILQYAPSVAHFVFCFSSADVDYKTLFFPSLISLSLSWLNLSSVPFLHIANDSSSFSWLDPFLFSLSLFPPLSLPPNHHLFLPDSSRLQAGQGIWVFDMAHKAEGHGTMSACITIIGCIMYTCAHTHIYTCTPFDSNSSILHGGWMHIIEQTSIKLYIKKTKTGTCLYSELDLQAQRWICTLESLEHVWYIYTIIIFVQHRSRLAQ